MTIEIEGRGRVVPGDNAHELRQLTWWKDEILRRLAIYEKRILVLEGKRQAGREDDAADMASLGEGVTDRNPDVTAVTPPVTGSVTPRNANAEKQRRHREREKIRAQLKALGDD